MTSSSGAGRRTHASTIINAPRERVYQAFLNSDSVASWLAPDRMKGRVHNFEPREGGEFQMSLTYLHPEDAGFGKTSEGTDTFAGRFVELVPNEKIVWVTEFESDDPDMTGEMTIIWRFVDAGEGTEVTVAFEDVPKGVRLEDNEEGSRQTLRKLAAFVEQGSNSSA